MIFQDFLYDLRVALRTKMFMYSSGLSVLFMSIVLSMYDYSPVQQAWLAVCAGGVLVLGFTGRFFGIKHKIKKNLEQRLLVSFLLSVVVLCTSYNLDVVYSITAQQFYGVLSKVLEIGSYVVMLVVLAYYGIKLIKYRIRM